jgi:DNA-binding FrmR family transcriptional regulator
MIDSRGGHYAMPDGAAGSRSNAALIRRLRRVEGQVQGLQKMVATERDRVEVLTLIAQVRGALHSVAALILEAHLVESAEVARQGAESDDRDRLVAKTVRIFKKWAT